MLLACVGPVLNQSTAHEAQVLLTCVRALYPPSDTRQLQGLVFYWQGHYLDAMQVLSDVECKSAAALIALCQQAMGEPSWWGAAQTLYESGDTDAMKLLGPWLQRPAQHSNEADQTSVSSVDPAGFNDFPFLPLRA